MLTTPNHEQGERDHFWPEFLPGGRAVLFTIVSNGAIDTAQIAVLDLQSGTQKILIRGGSHAHYVPSGHLVYAAGTSLRAVAFDSDRLEVIGTPTPVVPEMQRLLMVAATSASRSTVRWCMCREPALRSHAGSPGWIGRPRGAHSGTRALVHLTPVCHRMGRSWL